MWALRNIGQVKIEPQQVQTMRKLPSKKSTTWAQANLCLMQKSHCAGPLLTHDIGTLCMGF